MQIFIVTFLLHCRQNFLSLNKSTIYRSRFTFTQSSRISWSRSSENLAYPFESVGCVLIFNRTAIWNARSWGDAIRKIIHERVSLGDSNPVSNNNSKTNGWYRTPSCAIYNAERYKIKCCRPVGELKRSECDCNKNISSLERRDKFDGTRYRLRERWVGVRPLALVCVYIYIYRVWKDRNLLSIRMMAFRDWACFVSPWTEPSMLRPRPLLCIRRPILT